MRTRRLAVTGIAAIALGGGLMAATPAMAQTGQPAVPSVTAGWDDRCECHRKFHKRCRHHHRFFKRHRFRDYDDRYWYKYRHYYRW
jgi:hypothetical protein